MKRNTRVSRGKVLAQAFSASVVIALLMASTQSAFADAARAASAHAFGISSSGLVSLPKTPETNATAPPDSMDKKTLIPLNVGSTIVINATLTAESEARANSDLQAFLPDVDDNVNSRGFARTEGLKVLAAGVQLDATALVNVSLIEAEATAKCVNNQPVFDTGSRIIGEASVAGLNLAGLLDGVLGTVFNLTGEGGPLSFLVSITRNETGTLPDGGVFVNALRVKLLPSAGGSALLDIIVSHAEAKMPANCGVAAPAPGPQLAVTGGGGVVSFAGAGVLAAAVLAIVFLRRWRPEV